MGVVMLAIGSRGDVQPMAVLAGALRRRGVDARVVALADYEDLVTGLGGRFVPVDARLADVLDLTRSTFARFTMGSPLGQGIMLRRWLAGIAAPVADALLDTVAHRDTVLTGVLTRDVASALAEAGGCRPATLVFTGQLPTAHRESHYWADHYTRWSGYNVRAGHFNWSVASTLGAPVGDKVRRRLGLGRLGRSATTALADRHPVVLAASPVVVPPADDWPAHVHQTGFLAPPEEPFDPPPALAGFLAAGPQPVYVGFGSMAGSPGHDHLGDLVTASRLSGLRIVTPALDGEVPGPVGDSVLAIGSTPHPWLLPRMAAVVHHGGAGTTYAGLRSGRPSVAAPFGVDQPYHARRLHRLGVGPAPVPIRRLDAPRLARLLEELVRGRSAGRYAARAAELGRVTRAEDGVGMTVGLLDRLGLL